MNIITPPLPEDQQALLETAMHGARANFDEGCVQVAPELLVCRYDGQVAIGPVTIHQNRKDEFAAFLRGIRSLTKFSVLVTECWLATEDPVQAFTNPDPRPPRERPNRIEVVQLSFHSNDPGRTIILNATIAPERASLSNWDVMYDSAQPKTGQLMGRFFVAPDGN